MNRFVLPLLALLLAAPKPAVKTDPEAAAAPRPTVYILRIEEIGGSVTRLVPNAPQTAGEPVEPAPPPSEEVIHTTDVYVVADMYFRVKMKYLDQTRELRGILSENAESGFDLDLKCSSEKLLNDPKAAVKDRKDRSAVSASIKLELGKRTSLGSSLTSSNTTRRTGLFRTKVTQETRSVSKFCVTLLQEHPPAE